MATTYTIDLSACCCVTNCDDYPSSLFASFDGPYCAVACSSISLPVEMSNAGQPPCVWYFSAGGGSPTDCPDNRGLGVTIQINPDGTVTISSPAPSYCGPPTMTVTPSSLNPLYVQVTYDSGEGNNCCGEGEGGMVTLTISE